MKIRVPTLAGLALAVSLSYGCQEGSGPTALDSEGLAPSLEAATDPAAGAAPAVAVVPGGGAFQEFTVQAAAGSGLTGGDAVIRVVQASGDITPALERFRALLGEPNNGATPGEQPSGRREINWDGVPPELTNNNDFPGDLFNTASPRGAIYLTSGTGFRVSDNDFSDVNPTYAEEFNFFSPIRTFAQIGSKSMSQVFRVAGTDTEAGTTGFGVVFSDVDLPNTTRLQFFNRHGNLLGEFAAPTRKDEAGLSFLGAVFTNPVVARVRIVTGTAAVKPGRNDISDGGAEDVVVMDDFLYGEPKALP